MNCSGEKHWFIYRKWFLVSGSVFDKYSITNQDNSITEIL